MKMSQAYAWLAAGVLAAGLNASYNDGGLQRVHEMVDQVEHSSTAVLTLARLQTRLLQSVVSAQPLPGPHAGAPSDAGFACPLASSAPPQSTSVSLSFFTPSVGRRSRAQRAHPLSTITADRAQLANGAHWSSVRRRVRLPAGQ